jgi:hypothetical protein
MNLRGDTLQPNCPSNPSIKCIDQECRKSDDLEISTICDQPDGLSAVDSVEMPLERFQCCPEFISCDSVACAHESVHRDHSRVSSAICPDLEPLSSPLKATPRYRLTTGLCLLMVLTTLLITTYLLSPVLCGRVITPSGEQIRRRIMK